MPVQTKRTLVFNKQVNVNLQTREEMHDGKLYLVAPVVAVVEGVLNGELLLAEEFSRHIDAWASRPIPVHHPEDENGQPMSAGYPHIIESQVIGHFFYPRFEGNKLKGEIWFDLAKAERLGGEAQQVIDMVKNNEPVEVSTAYFNDFEPIEGTFNGEAYSGIQRNLRPDHLAVLPNDVGACNWDDGCGIRVNARGGEKMTFNEKVKALFTDWFAESVKESLFSDQGDVTDGLPDADTAVTENTEASTNEAEEDMHMTPEEKLQLVDQLIADDSNSFTEDDRAYLAATSEGMLMKMMPSGGEPAEENAENEVTETDETVTEDAAEGNPTAEAMEKEYEDNKSEEYKENSQAEQPKDFDPLQYLTEEQRQILTNAQENADSEKSKLVDRIASNSDWTVCELKGMNINQLKKIQSMTTPADYGGAGTVRTAPASNADDDAIPAPPPILMANKKKEQEGA